MEGYELHLAASYPIQPHHIADQNTERGFCLSGVFGSSAIEHDAGTLLVFFQERGSWEAFTEEEFAAKIGRSVPEPETMMSHYGRLLSRLDDGRYAVTHTFISRIFVKYPSLP